MKVLVS